jgi:hypothetical protein
MPDVCHAEFGTLRMFIEHRLRKRGRKKGRKNKEKKKERRRLRRNRQVKGWCK